MRIQPYPPRKKISKKHGVGSTVSDGCEALALEAPCCLFSLTVSCDSQVKKVHSRSTRNYLLHDDAGNGKKIDSGQLLIHFSEASANLSRCKKFFFKLALEFRYLNSYLYEGLYQLKHTCLKEKNKQTDATKFSQGNLLF